MKHLKLATVGVVYSVSMIVLLTVVGVVFFGKRSTVMKSPGC